MSKEQDSLADNPFTYNETSEGKVRISYNGQNVMTLKGQPAVKFLKKIGSKSGREAQKLMAVTTGNFKKRNEK